jgi:sugar O-acyltransferase (sialic acid O-acetyltransferase NeuD family)
MGADLVVVGAGGFGREALDAVRAANTAPGPHWRLVGVLDDAPSPANLTRLAERAVPYLGEVAGWLGRRRRPDTRYLIAIGSPAGRALLAARFEAAGLTAATVVHPRATLGSLVRLGPGSVVCAGVQVSTNVRVGAHVHLNPGSVIGHDCVLEDFVSVNPGAVVSGECRIAARALIGAGAVVLQRLSVGAASTVGAAACVTRSVEPGVVVVGVPARVTQRQASWQQPRVSL